MSQAEYEEMVKEPEEPTFPESNSKPSKQEDFPNPHQAKIYKKSYDHMEPEELDTEELDTILYSISGD